MFGIGELKGLLPLSSMRGFFVVVVVVVGYGYVYVGSFPGCCYVV